ncbi:MAG TPA: hypothetical protein V6D33_17880 [Cyanophyceae cyanobacterium]
MPKFKLTGLISAVVLMGTVLYGLVVLSQTPQSSVRLSAEPPIGQIFPFQAEATTAQSPVKLTLAAVDGAGQPLQQAKIRLQILTPPKNPWFPTDFPIVEGTELLNIEAIAPNGTLQVQQMLPIRGNYKLVVDVAPIAENAFKPFQQTLTLPVKEHGVKYRNFAILAVILLAVGFGGGWVLGEPQKLEPGEIAPQRVRLLLSGAILVAIAALLFINITAEVADSHTTGSHAPHPHRSEPSVLQSQGIEARLSGDVQATVGQPAKLAIQVIDTTINEPATDVLVKIRAMPTGEEWVAFAFQGMPDDNGKLTWEQQFFDGAPHSVEVEVSPQPDSDYQFSPLRVVQDMDVEGVAPPLSLRFIVLGYFTVIVVLGLLLGITIRRPSVWKLKH